MPKKPKVQDNGSNRRAELKVARTAANKARRLAKHHRQCLKQQQRMAECRATVRGRARALRRLHLQPEAQQAA